MGASRTVRGVDAANFGSSVLTDSLVGTREAIATPSFARHPPPACPLRTPAVRCAAARARRTYTTGWEARSGGARRRCVRLRSSTVRRAARWGRRTWWRIAGRTPTGSSSARSSRCWPTEGRPSREAWSARSWRRWTWTATGASTSTSSRGCCGACGGGGAGCCAAPSSSAPGPPTTTAVRRIPPEPPPATTP